MPFNVKTPEHLDRPSVIASLIDHTLLKPETTRHAVAKLCAEAREHSFATVCVNPCWVHFAAEELIGSAVKVCTVIGFPLGANETQTKLFESDLAISHGAAELDMVQNVGALLGGDLDYIRREIDRIAHVAHARGAILKVILETSLLDDDQKHTACLLAAESRADFVKTSTGFSGGGASVDDILLMRRAVGDSVGVKASGAVRTLATLTALVHAGATRIGTSSGLQILREVQESSGLSQIRSKAPANGDTAIDY